jgi:membrane-associated phospholipid phosphatase
MSVLWADDAPASSRVVAIAVVVIVTTLSVLVFGSSVHGQALGPDTPSRNLLRLPSENGRRAADWVSTGLVVTSLALPCLRDRTLRCVGNEAIQVGVGVLVDEVMKRTIHRTRPDGSDVKSFPSGHTNLACVAVIRSTVWELCPAVAVLRVMADRHYATDVTAGVLLAVPARWRWLQ